MSSTQAHTGTQSIALVGNTVNDCAWTWSTGTAGGNSPIYVGGHTYSLSYWLWVPAGAAPFSGRLTALSTSTVFVNGATYAATAKGAWSFHEFIWTPTTGGSDLTVRFYAASNLTYYVDDFAASDVTADNAGGGSTCGGPGQPACATDITGDSGGFFSGIASGIGSVLSSPLDAIKDAVEAMGQFVVDGFSALLLPSSGTTDGLSGMWDTAQTKFPFSVVTELVSLPATTIDSVRDGIEDGPPAGCSSYLCGASSAFEAVGEHAPTDVMRNVMAFILVSVFAYGVLRSIGETIK